MSGVAAYLHLVPGTASRWGQVALCYFQTGVDSQLGDSDSPDSSWVSHVSIATSTVRLHPIIQTWPHEELNHIVLTAVVLKK